MEYVRLGSSGLKVSRICLGMMSYGSPTSRKWMLPEDAAEPIVRQAVSVGPLFRYDRLALAESVMRWDDDSVRICSSLEFREAYANEEQSFVHHALGPAKDFLLTKLENGAIDKLIPQLNDVTIHLAYTRRRLQTRSTLFIRT